MVLRHGRGTAASNYLSEDIWAVVTLHISASCVTTVGMIIDREGDIKEVPHVHM